MIAGVVVVRKFEGMGGEYTRMFEGGRIGSRDGEGFYIRRRAWIKNEKKTKKGAWWRREEKGSQLSSCGV